MLKRHVSYLSLLGLLIAYSCQSGNKLTQTPKDHQPAASALKQSIPVESPWLYFGHFPYVTKDGTLSTASLIQNIKHDTALLNSMCAWQETTTVLDVTGGVTVQIPIVNASANGEKYSVIYEFKKYTNIDSGDVRFSVGVEVKLVANFSTVKGSVNLSLTGLGVAASAGKISGTISLSLYGASLSRISEAFTTTSSITAETIEKILQQVATLKSSIYDPGTTISPYVIDIKPLDTVKPIDWQNLQQKANSMNSSFKLSSK